MSGESLKVVETSRTAGDQNDLSSQGLHVRNRVERRPSLDSHLGDLSWNTVTAR